MEVVNFIVYHDGEKWIAENDELKVSGETISQLDEILKARLKKIKKGEVKVTMELDYRRNLPHWMWQYHSYYFYRTIYLNIE